MVLIIILIAVRVVVNNNTYWKTYYATDLALMADIENINNGDFVMNYALKEAPNNFWTKAYFINDRMFEIVLKPISVEVYDYPKEDSKYPTIFPYAKHKNVNVVNDTSSSNFFILSKIGTDLRISDYIIEEAEVCPSYATTKDTTFTIFNSINLDGKTLAYSDSIKAVLSRYGKGAHSTNESSIIIGYSSNFTIYYSDDINTLQSQKLACILKMKYSEKYVGENNTNGTPEIRKYDGSLDANPHFLSYVQNRQNSEYWIIVMLSDTELKIKQNDFAIIVEDAIIEYYE
ncbi:MAG: hypothetical protein ACP5NV_02585 [Candidatus Woesearchaeota archaeon]